MNQAVEESKTGSKTGAFMKDQVAAWVSSVVVGVITAFVISRLLNRRLAAIVTPLVVLLAHQQLDRPVANRIRKAWK